MNDTFEATWERITGLADRTFTTIRGKQFSYRAANGGISMKNAFLKSPRGTTRFVVLSG